MNDTTITALPTASGIDGAVDWLPIDRTSLGATQKINRQTFLGITGQPMDISSSQSVTNKSLDNTNTITLKDTLFTLQDDSDTTKQAKFQLSGITTATTRTYTLPNASSTIADISTAQTFTNKTLTSPVITGGSIDNTTLTVDTVSGHTTANSGTVYGIAVTSAKISGTVITNGTITSSQIATNGVAASNLATSAITLGYAQITTTFTTASTTAVQVTGLTAIVTIPSGGRRVKITAFFSATSNTGAAAGQLVTIWDGTVGSGTQLAQLELDQNTATFQVGGTCTAVISPSAGSKTYNIGFRVTSGTGSFVAAATAPAFILVEAI